MQESFLHFIWQFQYFDKTNLSTYDKEVLNILHPGTFNTDAGPDFKEARILINGIEWRGHAEIHYKSSDWKHHNHQHDEAYSSVVLHVVWKHDEEVERVDGTIIPTLELQHRIEDKLIFNYKKLINNPSRIPCEPQLDKAREITWLSLLDKMLMERLKKKALKVNLLLESNKGGWEETAYQLLAQNYGFKVNSESFLLLAQSLPYRIIKKHVHKTHQLEALLFGQAGFLDKPVPDAYFKQLASEYDFLHHKYSLRPGLAELQWKLLRLRPANFPMVRLTQFSRVLANHPTFFQNFIEIDKIDQLTRMLKFDLTGYWKDHYHWNKRAARPQQAIGSKSIENIAINTLAPLLVAYGKSIDDTRYIDRAVSLLQEVKPEKNKIINYWVSLGRRPSSAFESQALIQLYNEYCSRRRCLSCNVGISLVRNA